jgi:hypothetical protein
MNQSNHIKQKLIELHSGNIGQLTEHGVITK